MASDYNCWEGWELVGKPRSVVLRGTVVIEDEQVVGPRDGGVFLPRAIAPELLRTPADHAATAARIASAAAP
jgi:hypothetical protein